MTLAPAEAARSTRSVAVARRPFRIPGFKVAAASSAMRYHRRLDVALICADQAASAAGVFTQNRFCAAPVQWCRSQLADDPEGIKAVVVNAGIANACTGNRGLEMARRTAELAATALKVDSSRVLVASTGVIGPQIELEPLARVMPRLAAELRRDGWQQAAEAIMTTDTRPKLATAQLDLDGRSVTIGGIAKGSGMIAPNMATMLAFVCTDAAVDARVLNDMLRRSAQTTLNRVSVDGDTSTNDTVLALASGHAGNDPIAAIDSPSARRFQVGLEAVMLDLAKQIVLDGEGATKFIEIQVRGARCAGDARTIAFTIAHSPLVKTAFFGEDPNWGRIVAAAGRAGVELDPQRTTLSFADVVVFRDGMPVSNPDVEQQAGAVFRRKEIRVQLDVGIGSGECVVYTCDLSYDYVKINADYRS